MSRRSLVIVDHRYIKSTEKAKANIGYIGFRSREKDEETRGFFNATMDRGASQERMLHELDHNKALQHSRVVKTHTFVISVRQNTYDMMKVSSADLRDIARDLMRELGERKGMELTWIGALHEKSGHPHVHISVLGVGKHSDGSQHRLYLDNSDRKWMNERSVEKLFEHAPVIEHLAQLSDSMQMTRQGLHVMSKTDDEQPMRRRQRRRSKTRQDMQKETNQMQQRMSDAREHDI